MTALTVTHDAALPRLRTQRPQLPNRGPGVDPDKNKGGRRHIPSTLTGTWVTLVGEGGCRGPTLAGRLLRLVRSKQNTAQANPTQPSTGDRDPSPYVSKAPTWNSAPLALLTMAVVPREPFTSNWAHRWYEKGRPAPRTPQAATGGSCCNPPTPSPPTPSHPMRADRWAVPPGARGLLSRGPPAHGVDSDQRRTYLALHLFKRAAALTKAKHGLKPGALRGHHCPLGMPMP
jgi:hypothetical protein